MVCYNPILMYPVEGAITKNGKQHYSFYGSLASHPELAGDSRLETFSELLREVGEIVLGRLPLETTHVLA